MPTIKTLFCPLTHKCSKTKISTAQKYLNSSSSMLICLNGTHILLGCRSKKYKGFSKLEWSIDYLLKHLTNLQTFLKTFSEPTSLYNYSYNARTNRCSNNSQITLTVKICEIFSYELDFTRICLETTKKNHCEKLWE
jgi:hypothetical protein